MHLLPPARASYSAHGSCSCAQTHSKYPQQGSHVGKSVLPLACTSPPSLSTCRCFFPYLFRNKCSLNDTQISIQNDGAKSRNWQSQTVSILPYTEDKCTAIIYILYTYLFSVGVFCLHVCLCMRHMPYLGRPKKCIIIDDCELLRGCPELGLGPLKSCLCL